MDTDGAVFKAWAVFKVDSPIKTIQDSISQVLHGAHHRLLSPPAAERERANVQVPAPLANRPVAVRTIHQAPIHGQQHMRKDHGKDDDRKWLIEREKAKLEIWAAGELSEAQGRLQSELHRKVLRLIRERDIAKEKLQELKEELVKAREEIDARIRAAEDKEREVEKCYEQSYKEAESSYRLLIDQVRTSLEDEARVKLRTAIANRVPLRGSSRQKSSG